MVSTEYPPMLGGIARYTANLTRALHMVGLDVYVTCNERGNGDFLGLSPTNAKNSELLLKIVEDLKPDIIHIQYHPILYGLRFDSKESRRVCTYIDRLFIKCKIPIVTTFHEAHISLPDWIKYTGGICEFGRPLRIISPLKKYALDCLAYNNLINERVKLSAACIVFSQYLAKRLDSGDKCHIIYHGSEPALSAATLSCSDKNQARKKFLQSSNKDQKIALAFGFRTNDKGWDILNVMNIPAEWMVVVNSSRSCFDKENPDLNWSRKKVSKNIIDLHRGYLTDEDLSMLFYASDAVVLPYKVTSGSGVMFDALAHGLPFVATDLEFFKEFSKQGLGIAVKRRPEEFSKGLEILASNNSKYLEAVDRFRQKLKWSSIAEQHAKLYQTILERVNS